MSGYETNKSDVCLGPGRVRLAVICDEAQPGALKAVYSWSRGQGIQ